MRYTHFILRVVGFAALCYLFEVPTFAAETGEIADAAPSPAVQISPRLLSIIQVVMMCIAFLIAIVPHEVAHGYAAEKLGDPTARRLGRITFNPFPHVDLVMTVIFPAVLIFSGSPIIFGGAKPVPVDPRHFSNPRKGMALVAIAGPLCNFAIAVACIAAMPLSGFLLQSLSIAPLYISLSLELLYLTAAINLFLGLFNLIPIPPLDGGRIAVGFLPLPIARQWARLEPFGFLIVIGLLIAGAIDFIVMPVMFFLEWLSKAFL